MNFPVNQKTGALAEFSVASRFTSWFWTVGQDRIDVGYDLTVEPDQTQFKGHRFLVQIKGTASRKKGKIVAPVAKSRLRQYAVNPLPVFLVRQTADGKQYWLHVQPWAKANERRLAGTGKTGVPIPSDQKLEDQALFVRYLAQILQPLPERAGAVRALAAERGQYLSSIDPRFNVRVDLMDGVELYEISGRGPDAKVSLSIQAANDPETIAELRSTLRFGLPTTVDVDAAQVIGSELFEALRINQSGPRSLTIASMQSHDGHVSLISGWKRSIFAQEFSFPARMYRGQSGLGVTSEDQPGVLDFTLRLGEGERFDGRLECNLWTRSDHLCEAPLKHCTALKPLGAWAADVLEKGFLMIDLTFNEKRGLLHMPASLVTQWTGFLVYARTIGQLHEIARALNSNFTLERDAILTSEQVDEIQLFYGLLKGERQEVTIDNFQFEIEDPSMIGDYVSYTYKTAITLSIGGGSIGEVPVAIDLDNYQLDLIPDSNKCRMRTIEGSKAYIYHQESR